MKAYRHVLCLILVPLFISICNGTWHLDRSGSRRTNGGLTLGDQIVRRNDEGPERTTPMWRAVRPAPIYWTKDRESPEPVCFDGCGSEGGVADRRPAAVFANSSGVMLSSEL